MNDNQTTKVDLRHKKKKNGKNLRYKGHVHLPQNSRSFKEDATRIPLNGTRDYNLDLVKALCIILVLFWHIQPIRIYTTSKSFISIFVQSILNTFNSQITLIAVPLFYIVSIYLFYLNDKKGMNYFKYRLLRISSLYIFWTIIQYIIFFATTKHFYGYIPDRNLVLSLFIGGPDLPNVGGSVFYFLSNMFMLTCFAFFYGWKGEVRVWLIISYIMIVFLIIYFEIMNINGISIPSRRIDNFIIYVPIGYLLFNKPNLIKYKYIFVILFIISTVQDIFITKLYYVNFTYARIPIVFGAISIYSLIRENKFSKNKFVIFLSKYSLGIFATHKYWLLFISIILSGIFNINPFDLKNSGFVLSQFWLINGFVTIILTLISTYFLGMTPLRRFVL
jgi:hypothetical protein